jgi:hypothetical protein
VDYAAVGRGFAVVVYPHCRSRLLKWGLVSRLNPSVYVSPRHGPIRLVATMTSSTQPGLEWTDDNHAHQNHAHYYAYEVSDDTSDRKWRLEISSMHTDVPAQVEDRLGEFRLKTLAEAKSMAEGLADQRGLTW